MEKEIIKLNKTFFFLNPTYNIFVRARQLFMSGSVTSKVWAQNK